MTIEETQRTAWYAFDGNGIELEIATPMRPEEIRKYDRPKTPDPVPDPRSN